MINQIQYSIHKIFQSNYTPIINLIIFSIVYLIFYGHNITYCMNESNDPFENEILKLSQENKKLVTKIKRLTQSNSDLISEFASLINEKNDIINFQQQKELSYRQTINNLNTQQQLLFNQTQMLEQELHSTRAQLEQINNENITLRREIEEHKDSTRTFINTLVELEDNFIKTKKRK